MKNYLSKNYQETFRLGELLGAQCKGGKIFALNGPLGAGKTVLAQGLAQGLGVTVTVNSPTFNIVKIYPVKKNPLIKEFMHNFQYFINNELSSQYKPKNVISEEIIHPEDNEKIKKIELIYPSDYEISEVELIEQFFDELKRFLSKKSKSMEEFKKYLYLIRKIWIIFNKEEKLT